MNITVDKKAQDEFNGLSASPVKYILFFTLTTLILLVTGFGLNANDGKVPASSLVKINITKIVSMNKTFAPLFFEVKSWIGK